MKAVEIIKEVIGKDLRAKEHNQAISFINYFPPRNMILVMGVKHTDLSSAVHDNIMNTKTLFANGNVTFFVVSKHNEDKTCTLGDEVILMTKVAPIVVNTDAINNLSVGNTIKGRVVTKDLETIEDEFNKGNIIDTPHTPVIVVEFMLVSSAFVQGTSIYTGGIVTTVDPDDVHNQVVDDIRMLKENMTAEDAETTEDAPALEKVDA